MAAASPRSPRSITALRISAGLTPAALATASVMTPASAPWRASPTRTRRTNSASCSLQPPRKTTEFLRPGRFGTGAGGDSDLAQQRIEAHDVRRIPGRTGRRGRVETGHGGPADPDRPLTGSRQQEADRRHDLGTAETDQTGRPGAATWPSGSTWFAVPPLSPPVRPAASSHCGADTGPGCASRLERRSISDRTGRGPDRPPSPGPGRSGGRPGLTSRRRRAARSRRPGGRRRRRPPPGTDG